MNFRKKKIFIMMIAVFLAGCQSPQGADEYQGQHWYEDYQPYTYESIMTEEISQDSISDSWIYGRVIGRGQDLASDETWYYCYNYLDEGKLYRINKSDFSQKEKLSDMVALDINVIDGRLYFYNENETQENPAGIYRMNTDGSELTWLSPVIPSSMQVVNDWIYYIDAQLGGIYKLHVQQKETILLKDLPSCYYLRVAENRMYFRYGEDEEIYIASMDVNGEQFKQSPVSGSYWGLVIDGSQIYCARDNDTILKIDSETLEIQEEFEVSISSGLDLAEGYLYFLNEEENDAMARMDVATGEIFTSEHSYIVGYALFDGMLCTTTVKDAQPLVRVNRLDDGSPVSFYE